MPTTLSLKTLSPTAWAFPALVLAGVVVSIFVVVMPQTRALSEQREEMKIEEERHARLVEKRSYLESLSERELEQQLRDVELALPSSKPVFTFLSSLVGLVDDVEGLDVNNYDFSPGKIASESAEEQAGREKAGQISWLPIEIGFSGSLELILELVTRLEEIAPLVDINGFELSGDLNEEEIAVDDDRNIEMTMNMYYSLAPDSLGKPSDPLAELTERDYEVLGVAQSLRTYEGIANQFGEEFDQEREDIFNF